MAKKDAAKSTATVDEIVQATGPLVFLSHDTRDADFAEAFGKLLKSVSAGMLKTFRSSDKKGTDGIEFGDEWFKQLTEKLQIASDVVCLFTERSLERPWILYEAGVARGTLKTPVLGIALGIPLSKISTGPFYHFQNSDDGEDSLTKLVLQLARRVPGLEPDADVVRTQVKAFKDTEAKLIEKLASKSSAPKEPQSVEENLMAKFLEEMKGLVRELPSRVAERVVDGDDLVRRKRRHRFHPMMIEHLLHMADDPDDPIGLLMIAGSIRDDFPWFYEVLVETYRALRSGEIDSVEEHLKQLRRMCDLLGHGPFLEEMGSAGKDMHMFLMELPRRLERTVRRNMTVKKISRKERGPSLGM